MQGFGINFQPNFMHTGSAGPRQVLGWSKTQLWRPPLCIIISKSEKNMFFLYFSLPRSLVLGDWSGRYTPDSWRSEVFFITILSLWIPITDIFPLFLIIISFMSFNLSLLFSPSKFFFWYKLFCQFCQIFPLLVI